MKNHILIILFAAFCVGCATPAVVGPTPNVAPAKTSNEATQKNISALKEEIRDLRAALRNAQKSGQEGDKNLEIVGEDLDKLIKGKQ